MPIKISKDARKLLDKCEARIMAVAPPPAPPKVIVAALSNNPDESCIAALRVLAVRRDTKLLVLLRKKDSKPHEVVDYYPATNEVECRHPYDNGNKHLYYRFKVDAGLEAKYQPFWRDL
jgi:hypothetical protein